MKRRNFKELQAKMSPERQARNEMWIAGWKARYVGTPLEHGSPEWRDGWGEADQVILGEWASKNSIGILAQGFSPTRSADDKEIKIAELETRINDLEREAELYWGFAPRSRPTPSQVPGPTGEREK